MSVSCSTHDVKTPEVEHSLLTMFAWATILSSAAVKRIMELSVESASRACPEQESSWMLGMPWKGLTEMAVWSEVELVR